MNIHEYQSKAILKKFGIKIPNGIPVFSLSEIEKKYKTLKTKKIVLKAQIHAGGRGKAGGIKLIKNVEDLQFEGMKANIIHEVCGADSVNIFLTVKSNKEHGKERNFSLDI